MRVSCWQWHAASVCHPPKISAWGPWFPEGAPGWSTGLILHGASVPSALMFILSNAKGGCCLNSENFCNRRLLTIPHVDHCDQGGIDPSSHSFRTSHATNECRRNGLTHSEHVHLRSVIPCVLMAICTSPACCCCKATAASCMQSTVMEDGYNSL